MYLSIALINSCFNKTFYKHVECDTLLISAMTLSIVYFGHGTNFTDFVIFPDWGTDETIGLGWANTNLPHAHTRNGTNTAALSRLKGDHLI